MVKDLINSIADVRAYVAEELPLALLGVVWLVVGYRIWNAVTRRSTPAFA